MKRIFVTLMLWLLCGSAGAAAPTVRMVLQAKQPVLVGQQVRIDVKIMAPNYFTSAPAFPPLQVTGAIVTMPDETGHNSAETLGGVSFAAVSKTYVFVAQQAGDFELPAVTSKFSYGGDDGKPRQGSVTFPKLRIQVKLPAGMKADAVQPVARITIKQTLDRAVGADGSVQVQAGDAFVRRIDTFAEQTQAMMIPPPPHDAPAGVRAFAADPQLDDEKGPRGEFLGGRRIDRITYVFEKPGRYTLPAIDIGWYDVRNQRQQNAEAPALSITVAPARQSTGIAPEAASAPMASTRVHERPWWRRVAWRQILAGLVLVAALVWLARRLAPRLHRWQAARAQREQARRVGEPAMFAAVEAACRRQDAQASYAALLAWSQRHLPGGLAAWCRAQRNVELDTALRALEARLYGGMDNSGWDATALQKSLTATRARWLAGLASPHAHFSLPALNRLS